MKMIKNGENNLHAFIIEGIKDYDKAIEAHEKGLYVEISGNLTRSKRAAMTCEEFRIIE